jgi:hypothetical protein
MDSLFLLSAQVSTEEYALLFAVRGRPVKRMHPGPQPASPEPIVLAPSGRDPPLTANQDKAPPAAHLTTSHAMAIGLSYKTAWQRPSERAVLTQWIRKRILIPGAEVQNYCDANRTYYDMVFVSLWDAQKVPSRYRDSDKPCAKANLKSAAWEILLSILQVPSHLQYEVHGRWGMNGVGASPRQGKGWGKSRSKSVDIHREPSESAMAEDRRDTRDVTTRRPSAPAFTPTSSMDPEGNLNDTIGPLDAIVPRQLLFLVLDLFFHYVYPLATCLHKPTFLSDVARRREMDSGQEEWTVLVCRFPELYCPSPEEK